MTFTVIQFALALLAGIAVSAAVFFFLGISYRKKIAEKEISSAEEEARRILNEAIKSSESKKREALLEAKEEILRSRSEYEKEEKSRRADLQKQERRLQQKEEIWTGKQRTSSGKKRPCSISTRRPTGRGRKLTRSKTARRRCWRKSPASPWRMQRNI